MDAHYPVDEIPATPEYVLDVLQDWHAQLAAVGQAERDAPPTFETTAERFLEATVERTWEDYSWQGLADALNMMWELAADRGTWRSVLTPLDERTVRDICEFIAPRVRRPVIRPWRHVAGDCLPAGAFLTVRSLLAEKGVDPKRITPSTPLAPFARRWDEVLGWRLPRLAPGHVPPLLVVPDRPWCGRLGLLALVLVMGGLLVECCGLPAAGRTAIVVGGLLVFALTPFLGARPVDHPGLRTFRDLAYALAGQEPRRRIQPTP